MAGAGYCEGRTHTSQNGVEATVAHFVSLSDGLAGVGIGRVPRMVGSTKLLTGNFSRLACVLQPIKRTLYAASASLQDVCVDHRGRYVFVTEQFLHGADIAARFQ